MATTEVKRKHPQGKVRVEERIQKWLTKEGLEMIVGMRRRGYRIEDVRKRIGISHDQFSVIRKKHPELNEALRTGKELLDYRVEDALIRSALGYTTKEVRVTTIMRYGQVVEKQQEVLTKDVAPNVMAIQTYLFNKLPDDWKRNRDQVFDLDDEDSKISITVSRAALDTTREKAEILPEPGRESEPQVNQSVEVTAKPKSERKTKKEKEEEAIYGGPKPDKTVVDDDEWDEWSEFEDDED